MLRLRRRPAEYLARPGLPTRYSVDAAARLLGLKWQTVMRHISNGTIAAKKRPNNQWSIARSELIRFARELYADRPVKLARILADQLTVMALTEDPKIRILLAPYKPMYASCSFTMGLRLSVHPTSIVVIDWETAGSSHAKQIAERLNCCPDRPRLIGILPEFMNTTSTGWDALIARPTTRQALQSAIAQFRG